MVGWAPLLFLAQGLNVGKVREGWCSVVIQKKLVFPFVVSPSTLLRTEVVKKLSLHLSDTVSCRSSSVDVVMAHEVLRRHSRQQLAGIHLAFPSPALIKFEVGKDGSPITNVGDDRRRVFHDSERALWQFDLALSER